MDKLTRGANKHLHYSTGCSKIRSGDLEGWQLNSEVEGCEDKRDIYFCDLLHQERHVAKPLITASNRHDLVIKYADQRVAFDERKPTRCLLQEFRAVLLEITELCLELRNVYA